ncbi:MAG: tRNA (N6-isopentenyl adenosine(37)-C2)-methylthiotransferase MiaB [Pseudomonadales bacterium]|jgi:tRNA-2-methylthio-N6-dimethylallyladenosine synthase|nr:tRNA (N6-isopentenyl adenosine(37)-C2)-methylthiotransferase MiaB [Gammaproteobacteria bacterium]MCH1597044.1 tRNA (N6-isopentenyl adenosine(37)-C2)-methylthiotransferase MiaB [Pseudomonadales bacterium]RPG32607.1 MAG: tRNA (N6-isopentenyl adenosine(37)-C2)-methylthiotransferase MiaB [Gammaproteobacteria bacterium TMED243]|tara:strand:+ start:2392 stop:3717 length:1326 start_codon:yes stop_codon:yes gene_type:complete
MAKKLFVKTHGCQMNEYDSARMLDVLKDAQGYEIAASEEEADVLLLNTCSIREKAQEKVFHQLGRWQKLKNARPDLVIGVGGCVASQEGDAIMKRAPVVDMVFGPQTIHRLPDMVTQRQQQLLPVVDVTFPEVEKFDRLPEPSVDGPAAFVSIMEGCSKYCSFCVVPYTRGEEVSRSVASVIQEVESLASRGVREIHLLGQNVNSYLGDIDGDQADLAELIYYVADVPGVERIRFTTSHPMDFSDNLIQAYADIPALVDHLHLPVQSGSDRILEAMKRGHTAADYRERIRKLRAVRPNISLSSDFIVGFPGETEVEFEETMALIDEIGFDTSFSFIFSARPGTPAAGLADDIPETTKKAWLQTLQARIRDQAEAISQAMVGTEQRVLVMSEAKKGMGQLAARTENNRVVNFEGAPSLIGAFANLRITEALPNSLRGMLIDS